jgi:hypothetical protein
LALAIAMMSPSAYADAGLKIRPWSFGPGTEGAWKSKEGLSDSKGNAKFALYLQKAVPTATNAAAGASFQNFQAVPFANLNLSWDRPTTEYCGAGAPRWNVYVTGSDNVPYTVFLGCTYALHTPAPQDPTWIRDSFGYGDPVLAANTNLALSFLGYSATQLAAIQAGTVTGVEIVFDEQGSTHLDNITIGTKVFTGPMDNGS